MQSTERRRIFLSVINHIKAGKLRAIAISDPPLATLQQVRTFGEAGLPGYDLFNWYGTVAPAGTSKEIIGKMSREMAAILVMPEIQEILRRPGMEPFVSTPDQVAALIKMEITKHAKIIKTANIKLD